MTSSARFSGAPWPQAARPLSLKGSRQEWLDGRPSVTPSLHERTRFNTVPSVRPDRQQCVPSPSEAIEDDTGARARSPSPPRASFCRTQGRDSLADTPSARGTCVGTAMVDIPDTSRFTVSSLAGASNGVSWRLGLNRPRLATGGGRGVLAELPRPLRTDRTNVIPRTNATLARHGLRGRDQRRAERCPHTFFQKNDYERCGHPAATKHRSFPAPTPDVQSLARAAHRLDRSAARSAFFLLHPHRPQEKGRMKLPCKAQKQNARASRRDR